MRMRIVAAAVGVLVLALAGCSGGDEPEQPATTSMDAGENTSGGDESATGGDGGESGSADSTEGDASDSGSTPPDADLADTQFPVSAQDALSTSADEVGADGIVHAIELDYSDSSSAWVWSVKTLIDGTDHKVKIDADTGDVLDHEQESTDDQEQAVDLDSPMTWDDALAKAQAEVDGPVSGWKLEWDDQMAAYEFDIGSGSEEIEVTVNVDTGETTVDED